MVILRIVAFVFHRFRSFKHLFCLPALLLRIRVTK